MFVYICSSFPPLAPDTKSQRGTLSPCKNDITTIPAENDALETAIIHVKTTHYEEKIILHQWRFLAFLGVSLFEKLIGKSWGEVNLLFNVIINDISVIYVTAHRCAGGLLESRVVLIIKQPYDVQALAYLLSREIKHHSVANMEYYYSGTES